MTDFGSCVCSFDVATTQISLHYQVKFLLYWSLPMKEQIWPMEDFLCCILCNSNTDFLPCLHIQWLLCATSLTVGMLTTWLTTGTDHMSDVLYIIIYQLFCQRDNEHGWFQDWSACVCNWASCIYYIHGQEYVDTLPSHVRIHAQKFVDTL